MAMTSPPITPITRTGSRPSPPSQPMRHSDRLPLPPTPPPSPPLPAPPTSARNVRFGPAIPTAPTTPGPRAAQQRVPPPSVGSAPRRPSPPNRMVDVASVPRIPSMMIDTGSLDLSFLDSLAPTRHLSVQPRLRDPYSDSPSSSSAATVQSSTFPSPSSDDAHRVRSNPFPSKPRGGGATSPGGLEPIKPLRPAAAAGLVARSAVANYFNVDFSFLEEEPPSPPSSSSSSSCGAFTPMAQPGRPMAHFGTHKVEVAGDRWIRRDSMESIESDSYTSDQHDSSMSLAQALGAGPKLAKRRSSVGSSTSKKSMGSLSAGPKGFYGNQLGAASSSSMVFPSKRSNGKSPAMMSNASPALSSMSHDTARSISRPAAAGIAPIIVTRSSPHAQAPLSASDDISPTSSAYRRTSRASFAFTGTGFSRMSSGDTGTDRPRSDVSFEPKRQPREEKRMNASEKRKRLAIMLSESALAMEGGRTAPADIDEVSGAFASYSMATSSASPGGDPERSPRSIKSRSLASPNSRRLPFGESSPTSSPPGSTTRHRRRSSRGSQTQRRSTSSVYSSRVLQDGGSSPELPKRMSSLYSDNEGSPAGSPTMSKRPMTVYLTPTMGSPGDAILEDEEDDDEEEEMERVLEPSKPPRGLGLEYDSRSDARNARQAERRAQETESANATDDDADSVAAELENQLSELSKQQEETRKQEAKKSEKRRRTIAELIETEDAYATDMAVIRDIYYARAQGTDLEAIADHVMSTGLGLSTAGANPPSPTPNSERRMTMAAHLADRRPSLMPGSSLAERRPSLMAMGGGDNGRRPSLMPRRPSEKHVPQVAANGSAMSSKDLHVIFANLEEVADMAESFAGLLDGARGDESGMTDRIGEVFVEMIPRLEKIFSAYCARHSRAIARLQELEPTLKTYLQDCKTLSAGRTNAWDLASLLIKPVQRCLKYPLLLDSILELTPKDHPDRSNLKRANADMLVMADRINQVKKAHDTVGAVFSKKDPMSRVRDHSGLRASISGASGAASLGKVTKKLLRTSTKVKTGDLNDDMFDTLSGLVDSTRSSVLRFANEMRSFSKQTVGALEAQITLVEGWREVYAPMAGEAIVAGGGYERLSVFLEDVLKPVIGGPWQMMDDEIRTSLLIKTDHLLSLFENPRAVVAKRNDKLLIYSRYISKKSSDDKKGADEFLVLSQQLLEELPKFLASVSRYFDIIVGLFADVQAAFYAEIQQRWTEFSDQWCSTPSVHDASVEKSFAKDHMPIAQMMHALANGLGVTSSAGGSLAPSPALTGRSRSTLRQSDTPDSSYTRRSASQSGARHRSESIMSAGTRSSVGSTQMSFSFSSNADSASTQMGTPSQSSKTGSRDSAGWRSSASSFDNQKLQRRLSTGSAGRRGSVMSHSEPVPPLPLDRLDQRESWGNAAGPTPMLNKRQSSSSIISRTSTRDTRDTDMSFNRPAALMYEREPSRLRS